uniref:Secreted protein n=1 Tax=Steinernema glaseri TaxID=37863 RepID=A0A1I8A1M2_9BILA
MVVVISLVLFYTFWYYTILTPCVHCVSYELISADVEYVHINRSKISQIEETYIVHYQEAITVSYMYRRPI